MSRLRCSALGSKRLDILGCEWRTADEMIQSLSDNCVWTLASQYVLGNARLRRNENILLVLERQGSFLEWVLTTNEGNAH